MTNPVLTGLVTRRAELATEIGQTDGRLQSLLASLHAIDRAIAQFDPAYRPKKPKVSRAQRVELSRLALEVLRKVPAPMTLREVALGVMARAGEAPHDGRRF